MESLNTCSLCLNKCSPGIKLPENVLNSKRISISKAEEDIPVKIQLQIILLFRKILELPQEKCGDFLRDYGDPCSWIDCCDSCSTLVGECRIIFDQIVKLQKQFEHLQKEIKNTIIRSAKDEFHWEKGVQGEMRYFISKEFYQVHPMKEEFVGDLPCHDITIINETESENILGCFPEEIGDLELQQNSLIGVKNGFSTYPMNSLLYDNCDSEEQDPLRELDKRSDSDNQRDIKNVKVMSEGLYFLSKTTTLGTPFVNHLTEHLPDNAISTSSKASMYTEDKTLQCNICGDRFSELGHLHDHFCIPTENKPYINESLSGASNHSEENCYICIQGFNDPKDRNDHIISTQTTNNPPMDKQYNCDICGRCFSNYISLQKHEAIHSGNRCDIREKLLSNSTDLNDHVQTYTEGSSLQTKHKCESCDQCFENDRNLILHRRSHTMEKPYECKFCEKSFSHTYNLKRHERIHISDKEKPLKCGFCEKNFSRSDSLKDHERTHTGESPHKCKYCKKIFSRSHSLKKHERIHTGEKPYKCRYCQKLFSRSCLLKEHERSHTGEKPYKCRFCDKRFSISNSLKNHERTHTGERPYECKFCEKSFSVVTSLKVHERTHTGEKPYKCKFCEKRFVQLAGLNDHEARHTGDKPFKCRFCEKSFLRPIVLIKHEAMIHRGERHTQI